MTSAPPRSDMRSTSLEQSLKLSLAADERGVSDKVAIISSPLEVCC